ncbi:Divalent metal cation transporter MntH [Ralstonia mannitolilytica]|uniref:Nramp family divalent metal transporter n=1 Tax=Ralstonia mannitolilytica TaxID=105219 RepID=UPI0007B013A7|nr:Nramp family divalent metal transporter [Ralstonia mannitolilytica]ANA35118.1 iron transporter [Ralstonia mannitolilytica]ATG22301.1 divalent metal cation transporter [Ralstonia pickettii]CAJ0684572.1 Divalent metal cation transporter MntH [Ralstonia mannitolilytica]CAJ0863860.1 Divalent metal cation transporter MntH [Ralstonia mannitolilytica]
MPDADDAPWYRRLGPGFITGAADDDPSGIATYAQAGAQSGTSMLWTLLLTLPLMIAIQLVSARLGRVSGSGVVANIRRHHSPWLAYAFVALVTLANVINVGADIAAMGDSIRLLLGGSTALYACGFAVVSLVLQVWMPYRRYARYLQWVALSLLAYVATAFVVKVDWAHALHDTVVPKMQWSKDYVMTLIAVFGTTISPYLFVWQAAGEVEETRLAEGEEPLKKAPWQADAQLARIRLDTTVGMAVSALIAFCIMLTAAYALHTHGVTQIETCAQAAEALKPIAGRFAQMLFALGVVGTGLLAVPVLAGSAAYAAAEAFRWRRSLEDRPGRAPKFYLFLALVMLLGTGMVFLPVEPFKLLYWAAVLNGLAATPVMVMLQLMSRRKTVMGPFRSSPVLHGTAWVATICMCASTLLFFALAVLGD